MSCGRGGGFAFRSCCCSCWTAPCLLPPSSPRLLLLCPPPHHSSSSAAINTTSTTAAWSLARQTSSLLLPPQLLRHQSLLNKLIVGSKSCVVPESQELGHWNWRWSAVRPFASLGRRAEEDQQQQQGKMKMLKEMEKEATGGMPPAGDEEANNKKKLGKPEECTADELHYVAVPGTPWRLSLWRYLPSAKVRLHPLSMVLFCCCRLHSLFCCNVSLVVAASACEFPESSAIARTQNLNMNLDKTLDKILGCLWRVQEPVFLGFARKRVCGRRSSVLPLGSFVFCTTVCL